MEKKARRRSPGIDHPKTALAVHGLSIAYAEQGSYRSRSRFSDKGFAVFLQKAVENDHRSVVITLQNCAQMLRKSGRETAAAELELRVEKTPKTTGCDRAICRRTKSFETESARSVMAGNVLPRRLLHPRVGQKVWASFLRGDYDTAVFQAFKEVEVRVRELSGLSELDFGVSLVRKAFDPGNGPLSDMTSLLAERESLAHLLAGAIGSYKNPHSHRNVTIDPVEAVEMIVLASHLMSIAEKRDPAGKMVV